MDGASKVIAMPITTLVATSDAQALCGLTADSLGTKREHCSAVYRLTIRREPSSGRRRQKLPICRRTDF
jgi:hypothetical protein